MVSDRKGGQTVTTPRSPRGYMDRKVSAKEAVAKGTTGDNIVAEMLRQIGWAQVADLDRCYPGADLVAVCACEAKHILWAEVKAYPLGGIEDDSWEHLQDRAREVMARRRERFALFTYQKSDRAGRPPKGAKAHWWVCIERDWNNPLPFIKAKPWLTPSCVPPHPIGIVSNPPALSSAESGAVETCSCPAFDDTGAPVDDLSCPIHAPPAKQPGVR